MFRRSRIKIVATIMTILILLWVGTLGVIYGSSYYDMVKKNEEMLQAHAEMYTLSPKLGELMPPERPHPEGNHGFNHGFDAESPMFRLSNFYTVAVAYDGEILETKNDPPTVHTDDNLIDLAKQIIKDGEISGAENNLAFYRLDKDGYILVVFKDNTVINESAMTLFRYTLIFGGIAILLFFFLSVFLARKIVKPLEESYQKQKQFVSDAGHELKTPISVVSANAELLLREVGENKWLQNIQYENERMGILVTQLLELARAESVVPQMEHINFSRLIESEALPFESIAFEKGLVLDSDIKSDVSVKGNASQLKQSISILIDNAISHSEDGGEVRISLSQEHDHAILSVINKGEEIPMEQREQIFERFYRTDTARSSEDNHYGLGLAILKAIITAHKGHVEVLCNGGFVEFKIKIPTA